MADLLVVFNTYPVYFYGVVGVITLIFASFLNAAIYRIPIMLEREWQQGCEELKKQQQSADATTVSSAIEADTPHETFNLFLPRSRCPSCKQQINALENIPILSYHLLKGKCKNCKTAISIQYPLIELFTTLLALYIAYLYGPSVATVGLILLSWALITLSVIDIKTLYLPDMIVLPLVWLGILFNLFTTYTSLESSVIGAMAGYLSLWLVYQAFKLTTGKEGMGYGDFKLLAAIGAWGGWEILPFVIFFSAFTGAIGGTISLLLKKESLQQPIPFGPWLALSGFIALLWKDDILKLSQHFIA